MPSRFAWELFHILNRISLPTLNCLILPNSIAQWNTISKVKLPWISFPRLPLFNLIEASLKWIERNFLRIPTGSYITEFSTKCKDTSSLWFYFSYLNLDEREEAFLLDNKFHFSSLWFWKGSRFKARERRPKMGCKKKSVKRHKKRFRLLTKKIIKFTLDSQSRALRSATHSMWSRELLESKHWSRSSNPSVRQKRKSVFVERFGRRLINP